MPDPLLRFQEKLRALNQAYQEGVPSVLADIRNRWESVSTGERGGETTELRRVVHKLSGSAGTFGLPLLGQEAALLEALLDRIPLPDSQAPEGLVGVIQAQVDKLAKVWAGERTSQSQEPPREMPPGVSKARPIGRYFIQETLGVGGMGEVYKAWDPELGRWVAIKLMRTRLVPLRELDRFQKEAKILAGLDHPAIAPVYDAGLHQGSPYFVMKFIEGKTLRELFGDGASSPQDLLRAARFIRDAARAVQSSHARGVLHLDLKPGNIMVDKAGAVFVLDFGLARAVSGGGASLNSEDLMGTPQYMAPEQARREDSSLDARTDVYSLGMTLWALITGRPAFSAESTVVLLMKVCDDPLPSLKLLRPDLPGLLEIIISRALEKSPGKRYPTAAQFADDLDRFLDFWASRSPGSPADRPNRRALLVEDDQSLASLLREILTGEGYEVTVREDGVSGLQAALDLVPDLLVLDGNLPGMHGFEVLGKLRENPATCRMAVVMLTSIREEKEIVHAFGLGADDYLTKPFHPGELLARIRRIGSRK